MDAPMPTPVRSGPPSWLLPAAIGAVVALVVVLIVIVVGGDDDESVAPATSGSAAPSTVAATVPDATATVPATSDAGATTTAAAETSTAPTAVPGSEAATTTPATDGPAPVLAPGRATITSDGVTSSYTIAVTCTDFWAGVESTSHVLVHDTTGGVWVATVYAGEEGGPRGIHAVDMAAAIAADLYGQDTPGPSPTYLGDLDDSIAGLARTTASLSSGVGAPSVDIEFGEPAAADDCATGSLSVPSPFGPGEQVVWQPSDATMGLRFNVLAECGGELLLTGGALLTSRYPDAGDTMIASLTNAFVLTGEDATWSNFVTPEPNEAYVEQGGGGDVLAAIHVFRDGNRTSEPGYLEWTERPLRSSVGDAGLLDDVCPGP